MIDKGWGSPTVTKDGVTVAEEIELTDPYENMGAQLVKEAASKTSDSAGDGTTTATVLAEAIYKEGLKALAAGADAMALKRGIDKAVVAIVEHVKSQSKKVSGKKEITEVAAIAANNDKSIGEKLADAFEKVGTDGVITVEEGKGVRDHRRRGRGHAVRPRLLEPPLRDRPGADGSRPRRRLRPDLRREDQLARPS